MTSCCASNPYFEKCGLLTLSQQIGTSGGGRALQLSFMNKLPQTIFTQLKITAEDDGPLQIELRDAANQKRIVLGEGSWMQIQICVLDGGFGSNRNEDWTAEEFNAQTLSPRKQKGPLLIGDTVITLKNGVGYISNNLVFTDNSCWTKSKTFCLGVKVVQSNSIGAEIREGRSEPFRVLDYRGEAYKKHDRPSLTDEVWRLKRIGKVGKLKKQLNSNEIKTVKDLLQLYTTNPASLREKMGNIPGKLWGTIITHAKDCDVDNDPRYVYHIAEQSIYLLFNCIYEVVGVTSDGQNYSSIQSLNPEEKRLVERVKQQAYNNLKDLIPFETRTHGVENTLTGVQTAQYGGPDFDLPIAQLGQPVIRASSSRPVINEAAAQSGLVGSHQLPVLGEMPNWSAPTYIDDGNVSELLQIDQLATGFHSPNQLDQVHLYGDGAECNNHFFSPNSAVIIPMKGKRNKKVWQKIRTAFKWVMLHVAKRNAKLFPHYC